VIFGVVAMVLLVLVSVGGCGALVLGYATSVKEQGPQPSPELEADYRQVAHERGLDWALLAAWDGAENGFALPVPSQQEVYEDLVERELARKREHAERLCKSHPGDPLFCPPPEPGLDPEERDQLAQAAYRKWHRLVREHIGRHADWVSAHDDAVSELVGLLGPQVAELYDGYLLLEQFDQVDDHLHDVVDAEPPANWQPVDGFAWPAVGPITSRYGMRTSPIDGQRRLHAGIDLGVGTGTAVRASKAGTVTRAENDSVFGLVVVVDHGDGYSTLYAHSSRLEVREGEPVRQGQLLSESGTTGWSTGPHLHFEIHWQGAPVDPLLLLGR